MLVNRVPNSILWGRILIYLHNVTGAKQQSLLPLQIHINGMEVELSKE